MVADSQSSSQIGDISRFQGMHLITPTEHEARLAVRDSGSGLSVLADKRANAVVYIFEPSVLDFLVSLDKKEIDLSLAVLPHYLGRMQCFHNSDYHRDIGNTKSLRLAQLEF